MVYQHYCKGLAFDLQGLSILTSKYRPIRMAILRRHPQ